MGRTLLIVDDHDGFRQSASALFAAAGFTVVGEAGDGRQAIAETARLRPDVVLLDIQLPDLDGFDVAQMLLSGRHRPTIVMTSSHDAATYGARLPAAGTNGFLAKRGLSGAALTALVGRVNVGTALDT
jgi:DNA-binding NarL/FixJ family response regulator